MNNYTVSCKYSHLVMFLHRYIFYRAISLMSWVFANSPEDRGSDPGRVTSKTQKMVLDAALLNTVL